MSESESDRRLGRLVAESIRRSEGRPTMTDEEFDALVGQCLDDNVPEPTELDQPAYCPGCGDPPSKHHNGVYCAPIPDDPQAQGRMNAKPTDGSE